MEKRSQKPYLTDKYLLIAQDLWQAHYLILLKILLKEKKCKKKKKCKKTKQKQIKSTQADICLKCLKKSCLFTCMLFLKVFKKKSQRAKISGRKLLITS